MGGGNNKRLYSIVSCGWQENLPYKTPVLWHTECPDTEPWKWRLRVRDERDDITYAKLFFKKSKFITKVWYPCFLMATVFYTTKRFFGEGVFKKAAGRGKNEAASAFQEQVLKLNSSALDKKLSQFVFGT